MFSQQICIMKICIPVVIIVLYILSIIYQTKIENALKRDNVENFGAMPSSIYAMLYSPKIIMAIIVLFLLVVVLPLWLAIRRIRQMFGATSKILKTGAAVATGQATFSDINAAANSTMHLR